MNTSPTSVTRPRPPWSADHVTARQRVRFRAFWAAVFLGIGAILIIVSTVSGGSQPRYVIGVVLVAGAVVMCVAAVVARQSNGRRIIAGAAIASLLAAGCAVAVPWLALRDDRGDLLADFDVSGDVRDAAAVGDLVVLDMVDEHGFNPQVVIVDPATGDVLGSHANRTDNNVRFGRGPVAALLEHDDSTVTAIGTDGTELWSRNLATPETGDADVRLLSVSDDGTLVIHQRDRMAADEGELVAVDARGSERWRRDVPFQFWLPDHLVGQAEAAELPAAAVTVRQNPVQDGQRAVYTVDPATGEFEELGRALRAAVTARFVALLDVLDGACAVRFLNNQAEQLSDVGFDCPGGRDETISFGITLRHAVVQIFDADPVTNYFVAAATGEVEELDGEQAVFEPDVRPAVVDAAWAFTGEENADTVTRVRTDTSHNPLRPSNAVDVALFDVATEELCATARIDQARVPDLGFGAAFGLLGCRAVIEVDGEITLIGKKADE